MPYPFQRIWQEFWYVCGDVGLSISDNDGHSLFCSHVPCNGDLCVFHALFDNDVLPHSEILKGEMVKALLLQFLNYLFNVVIPFCFKYKQLMT